MCALAACAGPAQAQASDTVETIRREGRIVIGYRETAIPFSYLDGERRPVGFTLDLCARIVERLRLDWRLPALNVEYRPISSATVLPMLINGIIDLDCSATTHTPERARQVAFSLTFFVSQRQFVARAASGLTHGAQLAERSVAANAGGATIRYLYDMKAQRGYGGMTIVPAKDNAEGFLLMQTERVAAYFSDDVLLRGLIANAPSPGDFRLSVEKFGLEPLGLAMRRGDERLKQQVDAALRSLMASGELEALHVRWFERPIPPRGAVLGLPVSAELRAVLARPTDSADPEHYAVPAVAPRPRP